MTDKMGNIDKQSKDSFSDLLNFSAYKKVEKKGQLITAKEKDKCPGWRQILGCLNDEFSSSVLPQVFGTSDLDIHYGKMQLNLIQRSNSALGHTDIFEMREGDDGIVMAKKTSIYGRNLNEGLTDLEKEKRYYFKFHKWEQGEEEMFSHESWQEINEILKSHLGELGDMSAQEARELPFFIKTSMFQGALEGARNMSDWVCPNCGISKFKNYAAPCGCGANHTQKEFKKETKTLQPSETDLNNDLDKCFTGGFNLKIEDLYFYSGIRNLAYNKPLVDYICKNPTHFNWPVKSEHILDYLNKTDLRKDTSKERYIKYFISAAFLIHQIKQKNIKLGASTMTLLNDERMSYFGSKGGDEFMEVIKALNLSENLEVKECIDFMSSVCKNIDDNRQELNLIDDGLSESPSAVYKLFKQRLAQLMPIYEREKLTEEIAIEEGEHISTDSKKSSSYLKI